MNNNTPPKRSTVDGSGSGSPSNSPLLPPRPSSSSCAEGVSNDGVGVSNGNRSGGRDG
jgi:hypothetical protein